jgi:hypothetical protein
LELKEAMKDMAASMAGMNKGKTKLS